LAHQLVAEKVRANLADHFDVADSERREIGGHIAGASR